jgi:hypothetical protein
VEFILKCQGWEHTLFEFVESRKNLPFERGVHDCCLFAADWVLALTGVDYAAALRGTYADDESALAIIQAAGGIVPLVSRLVGEPIAVSLAQRGDVVAIKEGTTGAIGVCIGKYSVFVGHDKMYHIPTLKCDSAWRIA